MKINNIPMTKKEFNNVLVDIKIAIRENWHISIYADHYGVHTDIVIEDPLLDSNDNNYCVTTVTHNCTTNTEYSKEFYPHHC